MLGVTTNFMVYEYLHIYYLADPITIEESKSSIVKYEYDPENLVESSESKRTQEYIEVSKQIKREISDPDVTIRVLIENNLVDEKDEIMDMTENFDIDQGIMDLVFFTHINKTSWLLSTNYFCIILIVTKVTFKVV